MINKLRAISMLEERIEFFRHNKMMIEQHLPKHERQHLTYIAKIDELNTILHIIRCDPMLSYPIGSRFSDV